MSRFVRKIKVKNFSNLQVVILAAGVGARTKSYEPRCLLKYGNKIILDNQLEVLSETFEKAEISIVGGYDINRVIKKTGKRARIIENQLFNDTNSGESLRLAINNSLFDNVLFIHGDLVISREIFANINLNESFLLVDNQNKFEDKEVGITVVNGKATVLSYDLQTKWCQIGFLATEELNILKRLFLKSDFNPDYLLTFEIINKIIENGGKFNCYDIGNSFIKEIDTLKDISNEAIS